MILVLTNSDDATADFHCDRLKGESVAFLRFDTDSDFRRVSVGYDANGPILTVQGNQFSPSAFSHVWYRRPEPIKPPVVAPEAESWQIAYEWSEAIEGFLAHIPIAHWINHPSRNATASHKLEQLTRARSHGLSVPETLVTQSPDALAAFWRMCNGKVVVKPLACGYIERAQPEEDTQIYTNRVSEADLVASDTLANCPTFFQRLIDKAIDVRVVVLDCEMVAVALHGLDRDGFQRVDIRRNNMADVQYELVTIPGDVRDALLALTRSYELRFAAIDMAITTDGEWVFFEVNPNGQWAWLDLAGASDIAAKFVRVFVRGQVDA